jgi:phosphoglycolate phosphatase
MIQNVILDLDGPLLDGKMKHYTCYSEILRGLNYEPIGMDAYWQMKRERVGLAETLAASAAGAISERFKASWLELIEQPRFLALDRLQPCALSKLRKWRELNLRLILVTQRQHAEHLKSQLVTLGLASVLNDVIVCRHSEGGRGKVQRLQQAIPNISPEDCVWIGDSEIDVEAANSLGCPIWAVACGIRTADYLESLGADFVVPDITHVTLN